MRGHGIIHYRNYGLELIFKCLSTHYLYFNKFGLKEYNSRIGSKDIGQYDYSKFTVTPDTNLFLMPDFMYDEFTLLNTEIGDSPHYDLMYRLENQLDIVSSLYIRRSASGTLDMRPAYQYKDSYYKKRYKLAKSEMQENKLKPVFLCRVNRHLYILDGKHRLALTKVLDQNCPSIIVENLDIKLFYDVYWKKIFGTTGDRYLKHRRFFSQL